MSDEKIALITGANKGIGLESARQLAVRGVRVLLGSRDQARGKEAAGALTARGLPVVPLRIDVTDGASVDAAAREIGERYGRLDILVNNAGITGGYRDSPSEVTADQLREVYDTNVFGVVTVTNAMLPLLRRSEAGRVVNMSSGLGSLTLSSDPGSEFGDYNVVVYQSSKTALNAVTVGYAKELRGTGIKVNAADPGFTATDLNNHRGHRTVEQAAGVVVWLATLDADGPTGTFQDENGVVPW
ncbi:MAG: SDR family oxidoreductase [Streptosporangiaceae bacterium]|jgi:NAD(P)-dependent dehydrogenase (short-subunit alcohol dehydrogenase family)